MPLNGILQHSTASISGNFTFHAHTRTHIYRNLDFFSFSVFGFFLNFIFFAISKIFSFAKFEIFKFSVFLEISEKGLHHTKAACGESSVPPSFSQFCRMFIHLRLTVEKQCFCVPYFYGVKFTQ